MAGTSHRTRIRNRILRHCEALSRLTIWVGGGMVFAAAFLIVIEVFLRKLANISTGGADELSGYALAISSTFAMSFTLMRRAHVRVDALYSRLTTGYRAALDCLGLLCLSIFTVILTFFCIRVLLDTIALKAISNTTLAIPLWIPQSLWVIGLIQFSIVSILLAVFSLAALARRDFGIVQSLAGSRSADEELQSDFSERNEHTAGSGDA